MNAKKIIQSAFCELLRRQPIHTISVSQIIQEAEVSKPTFYRHFYNKFDLLNQVFEELLAPVREVGETLSWRDALCRVFENIERERAIFRNGFKTEDQYYLRNLSMQKILEDAILGILKKREADIEDPQLVFSVHACVIAHVSAMCGWALDQKHMPVGQAVDLLIGTLPVQLAPYLV